jgi:hypothetical protein
VNLATSDGGGSATSASVTRWRMPTVGGRRSRVAQARAEVEAHDRAPPPHGERDVCDQHPPTLWRVIRMSVRVSLMRARFRTHVLVVGHDRASG